MKTIAWKTTSQIALETAPKIQGQDQYIYDFGEGGVHAIKTFLQKVSASLVKVNASYLEQTSP